MNKIFDEFNKLSTQIRYGVFALVVLAVIGVDVAFLMLPQMASIRGMHDKIVQVSGDTQRVLTDRQRMAQLKKNLQEDRDAYSALAARIRPIQEVPAILSMISSIANEYSVNIDQLVPEKTQQDTLVTNADGKYYALPIVIKAHCGYHAFGHFLNKLESQNIFFIMKEFIIQTDQNNPNSELYSLIIKLVLVDKTAGKP